MARRSLQAIGRTKFSTDSLGYRYDGGSGKSILAHDLVFLKNYQLLPPNSTRDVAGLIDQFKDGYILDLPRSFSRNKKDSYCDLVGMVEDIKNKMLASGKYGGTMKYLINNRNVIFSNPFPNLSLMSKDRWVFYHTKLG